MTIIYKYKIQVAELQTVDMPIGAKILCVQVQHGEPHIWALVDNDRQIVHHHFEVYGTGFEIPVGMGVERKYIGTFQLQDGALVFHLFQYTGV